MYKTYIIRDDEGKKFEVTEQDVDETSKPVDKEDAEKIKDDALTEEEITALKSLAIRAADILKLLDIEKKEHEVVSDEDKETCDDTDEDKDEVIETKASDSTSSVGSIQKIAINTDVVDDREIEISKAWSDRFNKSYRKGE